MVSRLVERVSARAQALFYAVFRYVSVGAPQPIDRLLNTCYNTSIKPYKAEQERGFENRRAKRGERNYEVASLREI